MANASLFYFIEDVLLPTENKAASEAFRRLYLVCPLYEGALLLYQTASRRSHRPA